MSGQEWQWRVRCIGDGCGFVVSACDEQQARNLASVAKSPHATVVESRTVTYGEWTSDQAVMPTEDVAR